MRGSCLNPIPLVGGYLQPCHNTLHSHSFPSSSQHFIEIIESFVKCLQLPVNHHVVSYAAPILDLHAAQIHIAKQLLKSYD